MTDVSDLLRSPSGRNAIEAGAKELSPDADLARTQSREAWAESVLAAALPVLLEGMEPCAWCDGTGRAAPERNFLLVRLIHHDDYRWVGWSSDEMVRAAITGVSPSRWPFDGWDLGRCLVTRNVAPEHLHAAMDRYIEEAKPKVAKAHHGLDAAEKMAEEHTPAVAALIRETIAAEARQAAAETQTTNPEAKPPSAESGGALARLKEQDRGPESKETG